MSYWKGEGISQSFDDKSIGYPKPRELVHTCPVFFKSSETEDEFSILKRLGAAFFGHQPESKINEKVLVSTTKLLKPSADPAVFFFPTHSEGLRKDFWGATKPELGGFLGTSDVKFRVIPHHTAVPSNRKSQ